MLSLPHAEEKAELALAVIILVCCLELFKKSKKNRQLRKKMKQRRKLCENKKPKTKTVKWETSIRDSESRLGVALICLTEVVWSLNCLTSTPEGISSLVARGSSTITWQGMWMCRCLGSQSDMHALAASYPSTASMWSLLLIDEQCFELEVSGAPTQVSAVKA